MNRRIATVRNSEGHALHCILEEPAGGAAGAREAAVLLCPGIKTRVAPHRLYRKLAGSFLDRGIPVMRVDFRGLGDSEGEWPLDSLEAIYRSTELGHCVDDARSALDFLERQVGIRRFIVGGLCGGAITGLHLASQDRRVVGLYGIGLPTTLHGAGRKELDEIPRGELLAKRIRYLRKALQPSSWLRLITLQSDFGLMRRILVDGTRRPRRKAGERPALSIPGAPPPNSPPAADLNPALPGAVFAMLNAGCFALLIFGENDRQRWDFEEKFSGPWADALVPYGRLLSTAVISGANHILGDPAAVAEANRVTGDWLEAQFGATSVTRVGPEAARLAA